MTRPAAQQDLRARDDAGWADQVVALTTLLQQQRQQVADTVEAARRRCDDARAAQSGLGRSLAETGRDLAEQAGSVVSRLEAAERDAAHVAEQVEGVFDRSMTAMYAVQGAAEEAVEALATVAAGTSATAAEFSAASTEVAAFLDAQVSVVQQEADRFRTAVAEGVADIDARTMELTAAFSQLGTDTQEQVQGWLSDLEDALAGVEQRFDELRQQLDAIEHDSLSTVEQALVAVAGTRLGDRAAALSGALQRLASQARDGSDRADAGLGGLLGHMEDVARILETIRPVLRAVQTIVG